MPRLEAPRTRDAGGAAQPPAPASRHQATGAGLVRARAQEKVDFKRGGDACQHLEADAFGKPVLDHGDYALTDATPLTQSTLGGQALQSHAPKLDTEVQDHVLDRDRLLAKVVWHAPVNQEAIIWGSPHAYAAPVRRRRDHPREIVKRIEFSWPITTCCIQTGVDHGADGSHGADRYNRRLTCRGHSPAHARLPGHEEPIA